MSHSHSIGPYMCWDRNGRGGGRRFVGVMEREEKRYTSECLIIYIRTHIDIV
jgi:hypothetical protein